MHGIFYLLAKFIELCLFTEKTTLENLESEGLQHAWGIHWNVSVSGFDNLITILEITAKAFEGSGR